jgi:WhiB family redox-sensing transcriptional regulator
MPRGWHSTVSANQLAADLPPFRLDPRLACVRVDPDVFFTTGSNRQRAVAKEHCRPCLLRDTCQQWAVDTGQVHGVWGGLTEQQLRVAVRAKGGVQP